MNRARLVTLLCLCALPAVLRAATGGPDSADIAFVDSTEALGPPSTLITLGEPTDPGLADDGAVTVALPFAVDLYGTAVSALSASNDGTLSFDGALPLSSLTCPGSSATWSGVAALGQDWAADAFTYQIIGRYPHRAFVGQWSGGHGTAGGEGLVQAWLLEGRPEVVIVHDDLTFGDVSVDGGAGAIVGVHGLSADGLAWSCAGGLNDGVSAWFGLASARPAAADRLDSDLPAPWTGTTTNQYAGNSLAGGEINGDLYDDLLVGDSASNRAYLLFGGEAAASSTLDNAAAIFTRSGTAALGSATLMADLDGDGVDDIALGAPEDSTAAASAGVTYLVQGGSVGGTYSLPSAADLSIRGPTAAVSGYTRPAATYQRARSGKALAAGDINGDGYADLAIGAPEEDSIAINAGATFVMAGGANWFSASTASLNTPTAVFVGEAGNDYAGSSLALADLDADGDAELVIGAPYADSPAGSANTGRAYLVDGGALSGTYALSSAASAIFVGDAGSDELGWGIAIGDFDGDAAADLALGAPRADTSASDGGAAYAFFGASALSGTLSVSTAADAIVAGDRASLAAGSALLAVDLGGSVSSLLVAAPNDPGGISGGGSVNVFRSLSAGTQALSAADHRIFGTTSAGALGTALTAVADHQGDGYPDLVFGAPYAEADGVTGAGAVYLWSFLPDFPDADGDLFVDTAAGGLDCDDDNAAASPNGIELPANGVDDDCDGWTDDAVLLRLDLDLWRYDLDAELDVSDGETFNFETGTAGSPVDSLYLSRDLALSAEGSVTAATSVWGALPVDSLGAAVVAGATNALTLQLGAEIDALSFRLLDPDGAYTLTFKRGGVTVYTGALLDLSADNRSYGVPVGLTLSEPVDEVILQGELADAFGIDELTLVWAVETDRDGDGYTDNAGDCDDTDAAIYPLATEDLSNGKDDDCDGVIDGGSYLDYTAEAAFLSAAGFAPERIDFEGLSAGLALTSTYTELGLTGDGALTVSGDVDGSAPIDSFAASLSAGSATTLIFDEVQPAVGFYLLDANGPVNVVGRAGGVDLYSLSVNLPAEDTAGGRFVGLLFEYGVDEIELSAGSTLDVIGLDDLLFHPLGLDDADGDGFTESEGDCDDSAVTSGPTGTETWYDGVDADCDGLSDYDSDGDGVDASAYGGGDCDDAASSTYPGATEIWYDGVDADCDTLSDYDADADGHDSSTYGGSDCADASATINPEASEVWYDGVDDDCTSTNDDDADGDGYAASGYSGGALGGGDCDDSSAATSPGSTDTWYDGVDSDCSGSSDLDADGDGFDSEGYGGDDCDDSTATISPAQTTDRCYDGADANCDGLSDYDCDQDGAEAEAYGGTDCDDTDASIRPGATDDPDDGIDANCDDVNEFDDDLDGYDDALRGGDDCDDTDAAIHPGATELWYDGVDTDCDGLSDYDADADTFDSTAYGGLDCDDADGSIYPSALDLAYDGVDADCAGDNDLDADGDGYESDWYGGTDCDDSDLSVHPGAAEVWYDGVDGDCIGASDYDADGDGVDALAFGGDDCDDEDPDTFPGASDPGFDGLDQDCSGADSRDGDGDGFALEADCDDGDATVFPGATDPCYDGLDADCGGQDDDDCDQDGVAAASAGGTDCDDADPTALPGAEERWYDGVDSACDGGDDFDQDGDGHAITTGGGDDCDDTDPARSPEATELCNGVDDDCDAEVDEGCEITDGSDGGEADGGEADAGEADGGDDTSDPNAGWTPPEDNRTEEGVPKGGCATAPTPGWAGALLLTLGALLGRRRRPQ